MPCSLAWPVRSPVALANEPGPFALRRHTTSEPDPVLALRAPAAKRLLLAVGLAVAAPAWAMPAMPDSYAQVVWLMLRYGLPYSAVLYPALVLAPAYAIYASANRSRRHVDEVAVRTRRLRLWTVISLVPWALLGLWMLYDMATNKSI